MAENANNEIKISRVRKRLTIIIIDFGLFVEILPGVEGMVHISQLANKFVKDPADVVKLDQKVQVRVMEVDKARGRVSLSMKDV